MEFFDAHCHLQDARLGHQGDEVLEAAERAGVRHFSVHGTCEADWSKVRDLAERHPGAVVPNFGLHPWWVADRSEHWMQRLREALEAVPNAGLGECGLDKARVGAADLATQEAAFRQQLALGQELRRPISVHCVRAFGRLQEILQELGPFPAGLVLHSWVGPAAVARALSRIDGVHFSLSGHLTRLKHEKAAATARQIPLRRLLLETDAPDGLPRLPEGLGYGAELARRVEAAAGGDPAALLQAAPRGDGEASEVVGRFCRAMGDRTVFLCSGAGGCAEAGSGAAARQRLDQVTVPLDWRCPLDVSLQDNGSFRVEHPRQLLNTPQNVKTVLHLVVALREEDADEVAAAAFANAQQLFLQRY